MTQQKIAVSEGRATEATTETMLDAALELARGGFEVFPIWPVGPTHAKGTGKHPRCKHGHLDATRDEAQIERWWSEPERGAPDAWQCSPYNNVGIAVPDGKVIVDLDPRNGVWETLDKIETACGLDWITTLTVDTGGGGKQFYLSCEPGRRFPRNLNAHFGPGIDLKQCGGYVVAPPSKHKSGGAYSWDQSTIDILPAPAWLTLLSKVKSAEEGAPAPVVPDGAELDDDLRARLDQATELIEPFYTDGLKHYLALAVGGYFRNARLPAIAAKYVASQLPSTEPSARVKDALWAYSPGVHRPSGAKSLRELGRDDLLAALDALKLEPMSRLRDQQAKSSEKKRDKQAANDTYALAHGGVDAANTAEPSDESNPNERRTDLGNARRLVRGYGDSLRYFEARKLWYVWDGARW
ncbi:MAG TPA: bifunctional DNA primase/polymerase, partial [Polyangiaceae bacterium]|nr:bifunctional DNA primase/polymerase [Polyangiaceae bacterium]